MSALEFWGGADRGDGGIYQVADEGVTLVVGGPEGTSQFGQAAEGGTVRPLVLDGEDGDADGGGGRSGW